jgi:CRP-like cAMP-binding protein
MSTELDQLLARFDSPSDRLEAIKRQRVVQGNEAVASALVSAGSIEGFEPGRVMVHQQAFDQSAFLLLAGKVSLTINGCPLPYGREAGDIVGEMSAINPEIGRSATIEASEHVAALKIERDQLLEIGRENADLWRLLAIELTRKLEQRNQFIDCSNKIPCVFMISASERLELAQEIRLGLSQHGFDVIVWSDDQIFPPGNYPLEDLRKMVALADFGVALAHPDDIRRSRKSRQVSPATT